jgi:hypothetical protein
MPTAFQRRTGSTSSSATPKPASQCCNLLVERHAFLAAGGFVEDVWTAEDTLLSFKFACSHRLAWAPRAQVHHLHRTSIGELLLDQYKHGVGFATICARLDFPHAHVVRERRLALALIYRLLGLGKRLATHPVELARACLVAPFVAAGLGAWWWGLARAPRHPFPILPTPCTTQLVIGGRRPRCLASTRVGR